MSESRGATRNAVSGIADMRRALDAGETTARELAERSLTAIAASSNTLNAFHSVRTERALEEADAADRRIAAGDRAVLLGIPIAVKDDVDVAGDMTRMGCPGEFPTRAVDSDVVRRLRHGGAVIVGKTATPELMQWPITESSAGGVTRTPWNHDYTPGGSSGGAAAAVAAGLVAAALGSDSGGSVRIPAAWTHLVGVKPQRGRISMWPHDDCYGLTCLGPLTRTVEDAATMLDALTDPPGARGSFTESTRRDHGSLRIAVVMEAPFNAFRVRLDPRIRAAVESIADVLGELGHDVSEARLAYGPIAASFLPRAMVGTRDLTRFVADRGDLDRRTRVAARYGSVLDGLPLLAARRLEPLLRRRIGGIFAEYDVVLTPTTALPPLGVGAFDGLSRWETDRLTVTACPYAWAWNVTGWPAVNVPAGLIEGNLPIGASLLGPAASEGRLLALAAQLEARQVGAARLAPWVS